VRMFQCDNGVMFDLHKVVLVTPETGTVYLPGQTLQIKGKEMEVLRHTLRGTGEGFVRVQPENRR